MHRLLALVLMVPLAAQPASAGALDRAREMGELRLGVRADAEPFSSRDDKGEWTGFSVDLCRAVLAQAAATLGRELTEATVEVTAQDRFEAVRDGRVDLLCEATTMTLGRRELVDFTLPTFVTGATLLYRADGPDSFDELNGQKVGVLAGTTTEERLRTLLAANNIAAEVVPATTHDEGIAQLQAGTTAAYFGDQAILLFHLIQMGTDSGLRLSDRLLSLEPYALALPKGDDALRLVADRAIAGLSHSGRIAQIFTTNFGANASPSNLVEALWVLNRVPE
jgi:polar amino acid transport system substrate-binding protein/glutamate/aspartate transport system substrate-binding protein